MRRFLSAVLAIWGYTATAALAAPPGAMLPDGYLHTSGSQIVDQTGQPVRIAAIGWSGGDGGRYVPEGLYAVNYQQTMNAMRALGFNTIRLPWCDRWVSRPDTMPTNNAETVSVDYKLNPDLRGLTALEVTDRIVAYAGRIGLKIIFDHHNNACQGGQQTNGLWYDDSTSIRQFEDNWLALARRYKGNQAVIGYDLDNEPSDAAGWGAGGKNDWHAEAQKLGSMIQAIDSGPLIIVEGPMIWSPRPNMPTTAPEGNLQGVRSLPIVLPVPNKVVYSVHEYPVSVCDMKVNRSAATLVPHMNRVWGYLINENIAPVWIGEMGSSLQTEIDRHWAQTMLAYVNGDLADRGGPRFSGSQQGISWDWWNWGHLDGWVPDGILAQWTGEPRQDQYAIVERMLMRRNQVDQAAITHP